MTNKAHQLKAQVKVCIHDRQFMKIIDPQFILRYFLHKLAQRYRETEWGTKSIKVNVASWIGKFLVVLQLMAHLQLMVWFLFKELLQPALPLLQEWQFELNR